MTAEQTAKMQAYIERGYDLFTKRCAEGRHTTQDSIKAIAEGRVWAGSQALDNGLVDRMGTLRDAIFGMASDLNLKSYSVKEYPEMETKWWETLLTMEDLEMKADMAKELKTEQALEAVKLLTESPRIQCRMETVIIN